MATFDLRQYLEPSAAVRAFAAVVRAQYADFPFTARQFLSPEAYAKAIRDFLVGKGLALDPIGSYADIDDLLRAMVNAVEGGGPAPIALGNLALSTTAFNNTTPVGGVLADITGKTSGSTVSTADARFTVNGAGTQLLRGLGTWANGTSNLALAEALTGATNSPKTNNINVTISGVPVAPSDQTVTLRTTEQSSWVDLSPWLDTIPEENDIFATVTGGVKMAVQYLDDPDWQQKTGDPERLWVKRELYPFGRGAMQVAAYIDGASTGTSVATWTFRAKTGANDSGAESTYTVAFNYTDQPALTFDIGYRNNAGFGGADLTKLPGDPALWSVTSQSVPNLFAVFRNASAPNWHRLALNGTYGSTTLTVSPTIGATPTVTLTNSGSGQAVTLTANIKALELHGCPRVGLDAAGSSQMHTLCGRQLFVGEDIVLDDGIYPGGNVSLSTQLPMTNHPTIPMPRMTQPYVQGWSGHGLVTAHPAWNVMRSRTPLGARANETAGRHDTITFNHNRPSSGEPSLAGYVYLRFAGLRIVPFINGQIGGGVASKLVMMSHCAPLIADPVPGNTKGVTWNNQWEWNLGLLIRDCDFDCQSKPSVGNIGVNGRDCQVIGNQHREVVNDCHNNFMYNSSVENRTAWSWNFIKNYKTSGFAHIDAFQPSTTGSTATGVTPHRDPAVSPAGTIFDCGDWFGNAQALGEPSFGDAGSGADQGKAWPGGQHANAGAAATSFRSDCTYLIRIAGDALLDASYYFFTLPKLANGSFLVHNTISYDYGLLKGKLTGAGYAPLGAAANSGAVINNYMDSLSPDPSQTLIARNIRVNSNDLGIWTGALAAGATVVDNYAPNIGISTQADLDAANALFTNATIGDQAQTIGILADALTPKPGTPPLNFTKPAGAFAPKAVRLIDHRRRTVKLAATVA